MPSGVTLSVRGSLGAFDDLADNLGLDGEFPALTYGTAASQGAQVLAATANFAVAVTGSLLNLAWKGLEAYGPRLAHGLWDGVATYGPQLAKGLWNVTATYGPPAAMTLGKGAAWAGGHAWGVAKWGGNALSEAADRYQVKERAFEVGQELLGSVVKGLSSVVHADWGGSGEDARTQSLAQLEFLEPTSDELRQGQDMLGGQSSDAAPATQSMAFAKDMLVPTAQMAAPLQDAMSNDMALSSADSMEVLEDLDSDMDFPAMEHGSGLLACDSDVFEQGKTCSHGDSQFLSLARSTEIWSHLFQW